MCMYMETNDVIWISCD